MASTQGIRAGRAFVELFADDSKLVRGLRRAERKLKAFGDSVRNMGLKTMALGAAIIAPMLGAAKAFGSMGDQVAKMAKRTGFGVEALSELTFVASQMGTSLEALETGFRRMQRSIYDAGRGLSTQTDALADLGLEYKDLAGLAPEDQFKLLAEAISRVEDPTRKAALAQALFGRAGTQLLPMMASGAKGIEALQKEARRLGLTMSSEDAKAAEDFTDALDRLWKAIKMGVFNVGAALAPTLQKLADTITRVSMNISTWIKQNRQVIITVMQVAAIVVAAGAAMVVLGTIITSVGAALGALVGVMRFLVSPIGLVIAAVTVLGTYLVLASSAGGKALTWLGEKFRSLAGIAGDTFRGISDALMAGDISLAATVLFASLKLAWLTGTEELRKTWESFQAGISSTFIDLAATLRKAWAGFMSIWRKTTEVTANWLAKRFLELKGLFDESFDVDFAKQYADQQTADALRGIDREAKARKDAIEEERKARQKLNQEQYESNLSAQELALEAARDAFAKAIAESKGKRTAEDETGPSGMPEVPQFPDINDMLKQTAAKTSRGTFSGEAARRIFGASSDDRTAKATEATANNTKELGRLFRQMMDQGVNFA